jgi:hypothetical protein
MIFGLEYFPFFISGCLVIRDLFNIKSANFHSAESLQSSIWVNSSVTNPARNKYDLLTPEAGKIIYILYREQKVRKSKL